MSLVLKFLINVHIILCEIVDENKLESKVHFCK